MFGVICAGRPVQTNLTPLSPTQLTLSLPTTPPFNHLVVFLLPGSTLPPDTGAAVYIQFPSSASQPFGAAEQQPQFKFLGALAGEKQSAIFRINNPLAATGANGSLGGGGGAVDDDEMIDDDAPAAAGVGGGAGGGEITLGISLEPSSSIAQQLASLSSTTANNTTTTKPTPSFANSQPSTSTNPPGAFNSQQTSSNVGELMSGRAPPTKLLAQRIIKNAFNFLSGFVSSSTVGGEQEEVVPLRAFRDWWVKFERKVDLDPGFLERDEGDA
ncbi:MAG: DNA-directed RNA polymerases I, II, and III subunit RPABC3 [Chaenotheca gracillima]|nr:MAG: DNA-directed RNA polymerases I, II, and III subunit RPABC3 [Chaenotheca gracillima]